jgi:predicted 2-oxoglutarate/Fe(II)-dependent dioxygenase YbiX
MSLEKYIKIIDHAMPYPTLSNFLKYCNYVNYEKAKVVGDGTGAVEKSDVRNAQIKTLSNFNTELTEMHWSNYLFNLFQNGLSRYWDDNNLLRSNFTNHTENISILKYENTDFYKWHFDHHWSKPRTISMILLLNNDYEGGNLCFKEPNQDDEIIIDKKPNRLIIWPSNFLYPHAVKPVTKGTRYSVVCWAL